MAQVLSGTKQKYTALHKVHILMQASLPLGPYDPINPIILKVFNVVGEDEMKSTLKQENCNIDF